MTDKHAVSTHLDGDRQAAQRVLRNTYQSYKKQMRTISPTEMRARQGGLAVRTITD
jgi:hypothetical protein